MSQSIPEPGSLLKQGNKAILIYSKHAKNLTKRRKETSFHTLTFTHNLGLESAFSVHEKKHAPTAELFSSSAAANLHIPAWASEAEPAPTSWRAVPAIHTRGRTSQAALEIEYSHQYFIGLEQLCLSLKQSWWWQLFFQLPVVPKTPKDSFI